MEQKRVVVKLESFHSNLKNLMSIISKNWDEYFENYSKSIIDNLNVLFQISDPSKGLKSPHCEKILIHVRNGQSPKKNV